MGRSKAIIAKRMVILTVFMLTLMNIQSARAQDFPPFFDPYVNDESQGDPLTAPIDGFVGIALLVGAYMGAKALKKEE